MFECLSRVASKTPLSRLHPLQPCLDLGQLGSQGMLQGGCAGRWRAGQGDGWADVGARRRLAPTNAVIARRFLVALDFARSARVRIAGESSASGKEERASEVAYLQFRQLSTRFFRLRSLLSFATPSTTCLFIFSSPLRGALVV